MSAKELVNRIRSSQTELTAMLNSGKAPTDRAITAKRQELTTMLNEFDSLHEQSDLSSRLAALDELDAAPVSPFAVRERENAVDGRFRTWGQLIETVRQTKDGTDDREYDQQLREWLQSGGRYVGRRLHEVHAAERNNITIGSDPGGGYLLPADKRAQILAQLPAVSEIMSLVTPVEARSDTVKFPRVQVHGSSPDIFTSAGVGSMIEEIPSSTAGQNEQEFGQLEIPIMRARYQARPSIDWAEDVGLDFLINDAAENLTLLAEQQILVGDGIGPNVLGIVNMSDLPAATDISGTTADQISNTTAGLGSASKIIDWLYDVPGQYRRRPGFRVLFNSDTEKRIRQLVDAENRFLWTATGAFGAPETGLLGYRRAISEFMASGGTDNNIVGLAGDMSQILFATRGDMKIQIADQRFVDTNQIGVFVRFRFGVGLANVRAFRKADV